MGRYDDTDVAGSHESISAATPMRKLGASEPASPEARVQTPAEPAPGDASPSTSQRRPIIPHTSPPGSPSASAAALLAPAEADTGSPGKKKSSVFKKMFKGLSKSRRASIEHLSNP
mmetsp:Transcript_7514/g.19434  ORF Transcript_7514/g.19434 Transcript_7514/m.19434 type:complete len:116 (+) Transcript_7514:502-849(+)